MRKIMAMAPAMLAVSVLGVAGCATKGDVETVRSEIAAMAGTQDLDRMSGFRRAMPFTFGCMVIGGLALSGVPPFSGFWSKDEIISLLFAREDWHVVLG